MRGDKKGSSGKRVPARRERTISVCCELTLWGLFDFLALKGLHRVAQGKRSATLGRIGVQIIYNTLKGLHKKNI
jgi:hypothetical protein